MTKQQEKIYIEQAKKGDVRAFEKLVKMHYSRIYYFALTMTAGDHADAADIFQEAILKAFLNIGKFKEKSSFVTWLWRIIRNEFIKFNTRPKTRKESFGFETNVETPDSNPLSDELLVKKERKEKLLRMVSELDVKSKEILTLVDLQEMTYDEAADIIGITKNSARVRLFRAREKLLKVIENKNVFF